MHGVAFDPDGKLWVQSYYPTDSVMVPQLENDYGDSYAIHVFNADGTQVDFSPIKFAMSADGMIADTLGASWDGSEWQSGHATSGGRGITVDMEGNILASQYRTLYKFDYKTGAALAKNDFTDYPAGGSGLTKPAAGGNNVFVSFVVPGANKRGILVLNKDDLSVESTIGNADGTVPGLSRNLEVSADGHRVFWPMFLTQAIVEYARPDEFSDYDSVGVVISGVEGESMTRSPAGHLWIGSGSTRDLNMPTYDPDNVLETSWEPKTHYAFDMADLKPDMVPVAKDHIKWHATDSAVDDDGSGFPRGIGFSPDGKTVALAQFTGAPPLVRVYTGMTTTSAEDEPFELPEQFVLHQNYPNPFNPSTTIKYDVMEAAPVTVRIYDTLGRVVSTLVNGAMQQPGTYSVQWNGRTASGGQLASGMYFYSLETPNFRQVRQMVLVK